MIEGCFENHMKTKLSNGCVGNLTKDGACMLVWFHTMFWKQRLSFERGLKRIVIVSYIGSWS